MTGIGDIVGGGRAAEILRDPRSRMIMVIGASDSGKTTFVAALADRLSRKSPTAIVDLDMGQSRIGPPATVGWGRVAGGFPGWDRIRAEEFVFVGSFSPVGSLLPAVGGARRMTDAALASCRRVVVDTTGLVSGPVGRALKQYKIDILAPDVVVGLARGGELEAILAPFSFQTSPKILRIPASPAAAAKGAAMRAGHRREMMAAHFADAGDRPVSLGSVGVRFTRGPAPGDPDPFRGRLVSLRDGRGRDAALGIVLDVVPRSRTLVIRTPLPKEFPVATVVVGTVRFDLDSPSSILREWVS